MGRDRGGAVRAGLGDGGPCVRHSVCYGVRVIVFFVDY